MAKYKEIVFQLIKQSISIPIGRVLNGRTIKI